MSFEADHGMSYGDAEALAARVRRSLNLPPSASLPGLALFESLDTLSVTVRGKEIPFTYAVEEQELEGRTYFESRSGNIFVTVSNDTYYGLEVEAPRARFTLSHELGHPLCHPELLLRLAEIPHDKAALMRGQTTHPKYRDAEWQANAFAAALLMPADGLASLDSRQKLTSIEVEWAYGVSAQSASFRIDNFRRFRGAMLGGVARGQKMP